MANSFQLGPAAIREISLYQRPDRSPFLKDDVLSSLRIILGVWKWIDVTPDDGTLLQTEKVQEALNNCKPGQTAVLPPAINDANRFVRCGDITIPSGVNLESAGSSPYDWTIRCSRSLSQAFNSKIGRIWMKRCKVRFSGSPDLGTVTSSSGLFVTDTAKSWKTDEWTGCFIRIDSGTGSGQTKRIAGNTANTLRFLSSWTTQPDATSVYSINFSMSAIIFDGTQFDGTDYTDAYSASGNCIELANLAYDIKFLNGVQIWNYNGWGLAIYGNTDTANNTGDTYLATGVFITGDHLKIFNCGGLGAGGGILLKGGPKDGGSLHIGTLLLDHCQQAMVIDDSVSGNPDVKPPNSGGWVVNIDSLRCELNGKIAGGTEEMPSITNIRGNVNIGHIWYSSSITTNNYRNIYHRRGSLSILSGRMVKGGTNCFGVYCDPGRTAICNWQANYDYDIGRAILVKGNVGSSTGTLTAFRFELIKSSAGKTTLQIKATDGKSWAIGTGAGDQYNTTLSAEMTPGGGSVIVGAVFDRMYYEWKETGIFRIYPDNRTAINVLTAYIHKQSTAVSGLTMDLSIQSGENGFRVTFYKPDGTIADLSGDTTFPVGRVIEFSCLVALNPLL